MQIQHFRKLTKQHEGAVIGVLLLIGVVAAYNWVVDPHVTLLVAAQRYERAASRRIETTETINEDVRLQRDELQHLLSERATRSEMAFDTVAADEFLRRLQPLCREAGCDLVCLTYPEPEELTALVEPPTLDSEDDPEPVAIPVLVARRAQMEVQGRYENVVRLIGMLQSRREKVWVDELQISPAPSDAGNLTCNLGITIYVTCGKEMEYDE